MLLVQGKALLEEELNSLQSKLEVLGMSPVS